MFRVLLRWLNRTSAKSKTCLRSEDALAIARETAADENERESFSTTTLVQHENRAVWVVSQAAIGRILEVHVDDATGRIIERKWVGVR
jgi:hypothetical protein